MNHGRLSRRYCCVRVPFQFAGKTKLRECKRIADYVIDHRGYCGLHVPVEAVKDTGFTPMDGETK